MIYWHESMLPLFLLSLPLGSVSQWPESTGAMLCRELFSDFKEHCTCRQDSLSNGTRINCDGRSFFGTFVVLPYRQNIIQYSQSHAGLQDLESQLFTASDIPLQILDFSSNLLRRITDKVFDGIEDTLEHLELSHNLLGDQLTPVFGSKEFNRLNNLRYLGLSDNLIKAVGDNTFRGLVALKQLDLSQNEIRQVPSGALKHLEGVRHIDLSANRIKSIFEFPHLEHLLSLNLTNNSIISIETEGLSHLESLEVLDLSSNYIKTDLHLIGLSSLHTLNISNNLFQDIPSSIKKLTSLKHLDISKAKIRNLGYGPFSQLTKLEYLNLAWNEIVQIQANTFQGLARLKTLILDANILRKFEESHVTDLENLEELYLNDNQLLSFPTEIFLKLRSLQKLHLDFNRIAAISEELLRYAAKLHYLSLSYNLLTEIPEGTFRDMAQLRVLRLRGNNLKKFTPSSYGGLESSLIELDVADNQISYLPMLNLSALEVLDISGNQLVNLHSKMFSTSIKLKKLILARNLFSKIDPGWIEPLSQLEYLDVSGCQISIIYDSTFGSFLRAKHLHLANNGLEAFGRNINLETVEELDLSGNYLSDAKLNVKKLRTLNLSYNRLRAFNVSSNSPFALRKIDISFNRLQELRDDLFGVHLALAEVNLSNNMLSQISADVLQSFPNVKKFLLSGNQLHIIQDKTFSPLRSLSELDLSMNQIHTLEGTPFVNCSSLNSIDISHNLLETLTDECFNGISRLRLNLKGNQLHTIPQNTFSRTNVFALEAIDLAENEFFEFPELSLRRQYSVIDRANFSMNLIRSIPSNADVLVNVKHIDVSHNPLTSDAHYVLLGEPKSLRSLYMTNVSLKLIPDLETPFLRELVISDNEISGLAKTTFKRATGLVKLDLAGNKIVNFFGIDIALPRLEHLDLSGNQLYEITKKSFVALSELSTLKLSGLNNLTRMGCEAFRSQKRLNNLEILGYPKIKELNYSCMNIPSALETLMVEIKAPSLGAQLHKMYNPRLKKLLVAGDTLEQLTPTSLAGIRSERLDLIFYNTNLQNLPASLFLPLPLSSNIRLSAEYSQVMHFDPHLIQLINTRPNFIMSSFEGSPLQCDCNTTELYHALINKVDKFSDAGTIRCYTPLILRGIPLVNLQESQLQCDEDGLSRDIVTNDLSRSESNAPAKKDNPFKLDESLFKKPYRPSPTLVQDLVVRKTVITDPPFLTKVDMLIIIIISTVVILVTTISIGVCICKWYNRAEEMPYPPGAWATLPPHVAMPLPSKCTCVRPPSAPCTCRTPVTSVRGRTPDPYQRAMSRGPPMVMPPGINGHHLSRPPSMWDAQSWR
ncbi:chaoptin-like isoform X1 [Varroa destructor]|uniref:Chaoptin n=1 Tax=Varroa destructor TaxID=109461 RepID=A0A7M7MDL8_VARDE|nr:chaoptin-like isoform X1 [Varroa destructor]XP_022654285.1 chaoptin-like isoform X1 [Varroa destructor]